MPFQGHTAMPHVPRPAKFLFIAGAWKRQWTRADARAMKRQQRFESARAAERAAGHISNRSKKG